MRTGSTIAGGASGTPQKNKVKKAQKGKRGGHRPRLVSSRTVTGPLATAQVLRPNPGVPSGATAEGEGLPDASTFSSEREPLTASSEAHSITGMSSGTDWPARKQPTELQSWLRGRRKRKGFK